MIVATDLEGTLTAGATWKGIRSYLQAHDRGADYRAFLIPRLPGVLLYRLGLLNGEAFRNRWIAGLLAQFSGAPAEEFDRVAEWVVEQEMWPQRREHVLAEISEHLSAGHRVVLTSGTYLPIVERFAAKVGISEVIATPIAVEGGRLTGQPGGERNTGEAKARALRDLLGGTGPNLAYGDTMADRPMLEMAGEAVVVAPEAALAMLAQSHGWRVIEAGSGTS